MNPSQASTGSFEVGARLYSQASKYSSTRTNLTRSPPHIGNEIVKYSTEAIAILVCPRGGDIKRYLVVKLDGDMESNPMEDALRASIVRTIPEKPSEK